MLREVVLSNSIGFRLTRHISYWFILFLYFTVFPAIIEHNYIYFFKSNLLYLPLDIAITYYILYYLFPKYLVKNKNVLFVFHVVITYFILLIISEFVHIYIEPLFLKVEYIKLPISFILYNGISIYIKIILPAILIKAIKYWYFLSVKLIETEKINVENQMLFLRSQLHPHFLFNALNNIYTLSIEDSKKVPNVIIKMSDILRYILKDHNKNLVTLDQEIKMIDSYMEVEKLRYDNDLNINISNKIDKVSTFKIRIPSLLLFTFIENAFKHGLSNSLENPWMNISLDYINEVLIFCVENCKDPEFKKENTTSVGLKNTRKRLDLYYFNNYELNIEDKLSSYKSLLKINIKPIYEN